MAKLTISDASRVAGVARSTRVKAPKAAVVYIVAEHLHAPQCKIGVTSVLPKRLQDLQTGNPTALHIVHTWPMGSTREAQRFERWVLQRYAVLRLKGEWLNTSPWLLLKMISLDRQIEHLANRCATLDRRSQQLHRRARLVPSLWHEQDFAREGRVYGRILTQQDRVIKSIHDRHRQLRHTLDTYYGLLRRINGQADHH